MKLWGKVKSFWRNEDGLGTLEVLLIVVALVIVAMLFREQLTTWVTDLFDGIGERMNP